LALAVGATIVNAGGTAATTCTLIGVAVITCPSVVRQNAVTVWSPGVANVTVYVPPPPVWSRIDTLS